jgi:predicted ATPase
MAESPRHPDSAVQAESTASASVLPSSIETVLQSLGVTSSNSEPTTPAASHRGGNVAQAGSVRRIVLTGGPCAGKTTCLARVREAVEARTPYKVFCVPEAATLLVGGGLNWGDAKDDAAVLQYQLALLRTQLALEDAFLRIAATCGHPAIVIADRGTMDGRGYMPPHLWERMLSLEGFTTEALRDARYDAVIHLVTSAIGAEAFYSLDNPARYEDVTAAVVADHRTRRMYEGHPCVHFVDNSAPTFELKIQNAVNVVLKMLGHHGAHNHAAGQHDDGGANSGQEKLVSQNHNALPAADAAAKSHQVGDVDAQCAAHFDRQRRLGAASAPPEVALAEFNVRSASASAFIVLVAGCYAFSRLLSGVASLQK